MKLRNKKTGEIVPASSIAVGTGKDGKWYDSLSELNEVWEDYEEPKSYYGYDTTGNGVTWYPNPNQEDIEKDKEIGNHFATEEEAEKAVEKLKAWKRLKDKGFKLSGVVDTFFCLDIYMKGEQYEAIKDDLKIVFGGEE